MKKETKIASVNVRKADNTKQKEKNEMKDVCSEGRVHIINT
jgi:hypothetical protein